MRVSPDAIDVGIQSDPDSEEPHVSTPQIVSWLVPSCPITIQNMMVDCCGNIQHPDSQMQFYNVPRNHQHQLIQGLAVHETHHTSISSHPQYSKGNLSLSTPEIS